MSNCSSCNPMARLKWKDREEVIPAPVRHNLIVDDQLDSNIKHVFVWEGVTNMPQYLYMYSVRLLDNA